MELATKPAPQLQEQIAAAGAYEDFFVPALFRQWGRVLGGAARVTPGKRVLDVQLLACGRQRPGSVPGFRTRLARHETVAPRVYRPIQKSE